MGHDKTKFGCPLTLTLSRKRAREHYYPTEAIKEFVLARLPDDMKI